MKRIAYILAAFAILSFPACTPEKFGHLSADGIPSIDDYEVEIEVDQDINQVTFTMLNATGVMPVWYFEDEANPYSTVNGLQKIFSTAGEYTVAIKVMNANGISDGTKYRTFTIENTLVDFTKYITLLGGSSTSGSSKDWVMAKDEAGHFACGESGTDGTNWWSATPNEKAGEGIYDNILTFASDYGYTFNPGEGGTMYVNCGVTGLWSAYEDASLDYRVPMDLTTTTFSFSVDGDDVILKLPSETPFLYVPYEESWKNPTFTIESISSSKLVLIADNGEIAWHFVLSSGSSSSDTPFTGYDPDSEFNLWKSANPYLESCWYAPGWNQIADPDVTVNDNGDVTVSLPEATSEQWQAQVFIGTDLSLSSSISYDFSCIIYSTEAHKSITIKLTDSANDGNFLFTAYPVAVDAYEDYVYYQSDMAGIDADNVTLVLDFGGNIAGTEITVSDIVLKDHANDDGTVLPEDDNTGDGDVIWADVESEDNLWTSAGMYLSSTYYAPGWSEITGAETVTLNSNYSVTSIWPSATSDQWQAQVHLGTSLSMSSEYSYDFKCTIYSTTAQSNITVKLTDSTDDNNYLLVEYPISVSAYEDCTLTLTNLSGIDADNIKLVLDFGGCPAGTEVTVSDIVLQYHNASSSSSVSWVDVESSDNVWTSAGMYLSSTYYAPGWSEITGAETVTLNSNYSVTSIWPSATSDQWQAQVHLGTSLSMSSEYSYDFKCTIYSTTAQSNITVKLTDSSDDGNYLFCGEHISVSAYEDYDYTITKLTGINAGNVKLVLDFGGCPAGTEVTVYDIILQHHE